VGLRRVPAQAQAQIQRDQIDNGPHSLVLMDEVEEHSLASTYLFLVVVQTDRVVEVQTEESLDVQKKHMTWNQSLASKRTYPLLPRLSTRLCGPRVLSGEREYPL
jgi:hypothetical protein